MSSRRRIHSLLFTLLVATTTTMTSLNPASAGEHRYDLLLEGGHVIGALDWGPVERAAEAGRRTNLPVMVDFGDDFPERPLAVLLTEKLRPGDIYTHCYSGRRQELGADGHVNPGMIEGRERGVIFDVGHGAGSFFWRVAVPMVKEGFWPDSISTDLHINSMNSGMKDQLNVMSKFLAMGMALDDVILRSTWNPAREIQREELGNLSVGSPLRNRSNSPPTSSSSSRLQRSIPSARAGSCSMMRSPADTGCPSAAAMVSVSAILSRFSYVRVLLTRSWFSLSSAWIWSGVCGVMGIGCRGCRLCCAGRRPLFALKWDWSVLAASAALA